MSDFGFDLVTDIPTPAKLMFVGLGVVMLIWFLAAVAFGNERDIDG